MRFSKYEYFHILLSSTLNYHFLQSAYLTYQYIIKCIRHLSFSPILMLAFLNCSQLLYLSINIWNFICYHFLINLNFYFLPLQKQVLITYLCDDLQFADPWWFPVSWVDFFVRLPVDWTMHWQVLPLVSIKPLLIINGIQV